MTDPARRAKPVGPPPPGGAQQPPPSGATGGSSQRTEQGAYSGSGTPPGQPYVRVYRWSSQGGSFPWFAVLLLVLGIGLLIEILIPDLSFGSLLILAAGVAFGVAWLYGGVVGATMPALVLTAWGLASVGRDFELLTGDGWNTLFIGIAFLIGWAIARYQGVRREYALWIGAILGIIGFAETSEAALIDLCLAVGVQLVLIRVCV